MLEEICPECEIGLYALCTEPIVQGTSFVPCGLHLTEPDDQPVKPTSRQEFVDNMLQVDSLPKELTQSTTHKERKSELFTLDGRPKKQGRPQTPVEEIKHPARLGRARANKIKPIKQGDICEWSMLKYAGGGVEPIIGCYNNAAATVHHGPDKDYFNNNLNNLHKLCTVCHTLYHRKNDKYYVDERPEPGKAFYFKEEYYPLIRPHDPNTKATMKEVMLNIAEHNIGDRGSLSAEEIEELFPEDNPELTDN